MIQQCPICGIEFYTGYAARYGISDSVCPDCSSMIYGDYPSNEALNAWDKSPVSIEDTIEQIEKNSFMGLSELPEDYRLSENLADAIFHASKEEEKAIVEYLSCSESILRVIRRAIATAYINGYTDSEIERNG